MSVINQMLKDLDKRQSEQGDANHLVLPVSKKSSVGKWILLAVVIITFNVVGVLAWQLYSENQQLRAQAQQDNSVEATDSDRIETPIKNALNKMSPAGTSTGLVAETSQRVIAREGDVLKPDASASNSVDIEPSAGYKPENKLTAVKQSTTPVTDTSMVENSAVVVVTAFEVEKNSTELEPVPVFAKTKVEPKLTISRTQLSSKELAANKISEAEQAIERNDIMKAESLFEEVLLLIPEHETARKQLAALWYGKKSYQSAVNLLSQGIALAPQAEEMRVMSARIYYEQGQARQAYNVLAPLKLSTSKAVQVLLANTAAELSEHNNAISAYQNLIGLEPEVSRWWLGLAISFDSLGDFTSARDAYQQAIKRNNLSSSAMQFARKRLLELGE